MTPEFMRVTSEMTGQKFSSILLLGIDNPIALPVIRALGSKLPNVRIHALSRRNGDLPRVSRYSRYIKTHHYLKSSRGESLLQELVNLIKVTGATILLPVDEYFVRVLSSFKERLEKHVRLPPLPEVDTFDSLVYKNRLSELLAKYGFPGAVTCPLHQVDLSNLDKVCFPCLLKPVRGASGKGIQKIADREGLARSIENLDRDHYILQEFIPGQNIDCSLLAVDGVIKAFTIQKGLSNIGFIFSTAIKFEHNRDILGSVQRLVEKTRYNGLAHLDFRLDERDGKPKLIDFNARFWYSLLGSKAAGVDFTLLSCFAAMNIEFDEPAFTDTTYLMGRSTFQYMLKKKLKLFSYLASEPILTDLWDRIRDPLPEFARFFPDVRARV